MVKTRYIPVRGLFTPRCFRYIYIIIKIVYKSFYHFHLWFETETLMTSPVRETWYSDESPADTPGFVLSHDAALARYSMLNEGKRNSYAIGRDQFRNLLTHQHIALDPQHGGIRIEVWHYNPKLLSEKRTVDPLSLYLSMRDESDDRIKIALEEMINDIKW